MISGTMRSRGMENMAELGRHQAAFLKRKAVAEGRLFHVYEFITAIRDCPRNWHDPVLSTHANPKAGREASEEPLATGNFNPCRPVRSLFGRDGVGDGRKK